MECLPDVYQHVPLPSALQRHETQFIQSGPVVQSCHALQSLSETTLYVLNRLNFRGFDRTPDKAAVLQNRSYQDLE